MASVTGSQLAFFGNDSTGANVNIVLTPDGSGTLATVAGAYNIEVFTSVAGALGAGFQASVFIEGATQTANDGTAFANNVIQAGSLTSVEQILGGSLTMVDLTGFQNIQIVGAGSGGPASNITVVGARADTITGSATAENTQLIDASGAGLQNITGGAGNTTVFGGDVATITGGAGQLTVLGAVGGPHTGMTVTGGAGGLAASGFGQNNTIRGGGGITFIDDGFAGGGNNLLVGGSGGSNFIQGNTGDTIVGNDAAPITILNSFTFGGQTVLGGGGLSNIITAGTGDSIVAGSGLLSFIAAVDDSTIQGGTNVLGTTDVFALGDGNTVTGSTGSLIVGAAATNSVITGGAGNLQVFGLGTGNTVFGSTGGTTSINDVLGGGAVLVGGAFATTIIAGAGDSIVGAGGDLDVRFRSDIAGVETVNLSVGADIVRDVSIVGGAGATASVTGFSTTFDVIASSTSTGAELVATATTDGFGNVVLNFNDSSTMTLAGVTDVTAITFTA